MTEKKTSEAHVLASDSADRSVKPFELFFDLVFVYAFTQVTQLLAHELSWGGLGQGVLLISAMWLAWASYSWLGTHIDLDEGAVRLAMLVVMGGMLTAALAVPDAFGDRAVLFAVAYAFVRLMQVVMFGIAARNMDGLMPALARFARSAVVGPIIILVGALSKVGPLEAWWATALLFEYGAMYLMKMSGWRISAGHFSERHGLIFIIGLGEAVISIGIGAHDLALDAGVLIPALLGLGVIVALWWTYFDVNALAAERRLASVSGTERSELGRDAYSYLHLPMIIGAIFFSLGVKMTLAHTDEVLQTIPAAALCGGLVLYLLGQIGLRVRCGGSLAKARVLAVLSLTVLFGVSGLITALALLSAVSLSFAILVAWETVAQRESRQQIRSDEEATWS